MKQIPSVVLVAALAMALAAGGAQAQFFYSPPPPLMGQPSFHLYSVAGVISNGGLDTYFQCTNTTSANVRVGVEIFGPPGGGAANDPSTASVDIGPGATAMFGTGGAMWTGLDSNLGGAIAYGAARILATKRSGIICNAFVADPGNIPPTFMSKLTIVKKTSQKGE
jgi:hypothetical protein